MENSGDDELERICLYPRSKVGTEYSVADAVKAGIARKTKRKQKIDSKYQYCSRLVAESYAFAGLAITDEPSLCTPADILENMDLINVPGIIREALPEEIEFATNSTNNSASKQTTITNNIIRKTQEIFGSNVQTFEEIYLGLIKHPEHDELTEQLILESGYLTMWADDIVKCPYRYFKENYQDSRVIEALNVNGLRLELNLAEKDIMRFDGLRNNLLELHRTYPRRTFEQQINPYQILLSIAIQRRDLFIWLLGQKGA